MKNETLSLSKTIFFLNDSNNLKIDDILKSYNPYEIFKKKEVYLIANNTYYLGYDNVQDTIRKSNSIIKKRSIWIINDIIKYNNEYYFNFSTKDAYNYQGIQNYAYLDKYDHFNNELILWNKKNDKLPSGILDTQYF